MSPATPATLPQKGTLLDTSGLFAAADIRESRHGDAKAALERLVMSNVPLWITDVVVAELHGLAVRRLGPMRALELVERVLASPRLAVVPTGPHRIDRAIALLRARPGRGYSLADGLSFVVMRERSITTVFTLDQDFRAEGFATIPSYQTSDTWLTS